MGKLSRNKGAAFERRCKVIMASVTNHPFWKRARGGELQHYGDLVPTNSKGKILDDWNEGPIPYVECKKYSVIYEGLLLEWKEKIEERVSEFWREIESQGIEGEDLDYYPEMEWYLLYSQDKGPVYVLSNQELDSETLLGPAYITFQRS